MKSLSKKILILALALTLTLSCLVGCSSRGKKLMELEGEDGFDYIKEYSSSKTERGKKLRAAICEKLGFKSLEFQSLDGIVEAIGLKKSERCTYCWDGRE